MHSRRLSILLALALTSPLPAQWLFGQGGSPDPAPEAPPAPSSGLHLTEVIPPHPFVIGRDNLAFQNPHGALSVGGFAGNCYTMAWTARLFRQAALFRPEAGTEPRLDLQAVAATVNSPAFPRPPFPVPGAASLYQLSALPADAPDAFEPWVRATLSADARLDDAVPAGPRAPERLLQLYRLISTVHYLHYIQEQLGEFTRLVALGALAHQGSMPQRLNQTTLALTSHLLQADQTPILLIFNPDPAVTYGHAVLGYKLVEARDAGGALRHTDLYVYDSNLQHGDQLDETVLRFDAATGRHHLYRRRATTGELVPDDYYDRADWFTGPDVAVHVMNDPNQDPERRQRLAAKLMAAAEETSYMLVGDRFLEDLTTRSPEQSGIEQDLKRFVFRLQEARRHHGDPLQPELPSEASEDTFRRFLLLHCTRVLDEVAPYLLPAGVALKDAALDLPRGTPNRLTLHLAITLEGSGSLDEILAGLRSSALLAGATDLEAMLRGARDLIAGQRVDLDLRLEIEKGAALDPRLGAYGPRVRLVGSRIRIGTLDRTPPAEGDRISTRTAWFAPATEHQLHLDERVLDSLLQRLLTDTGVLGKTWTQTNLLPGGLKRDLEVTVDSAALQCNASGLQLSFELHGLAGVTGQRTGYVFDTSTNRGDRVVLPLSLQVSTPGELRVGLVPWGHLNVDDGLGGLTNGGMAFVLEALFPYFTGWIEDTLTEQVEGAVALVPGETVAVEDLRVKTGDGETLGFSANVPKVRMDVDATARKLAGGGLGLRISGVEVASDRLVLVFRESRR